MDSPDADDANSVMKCLLVSQDKIGCQLIEPVAASNYCEEEFRHHAYLWRRFRIMKVLKYRIVELKKRDLRAEFEDRNTEF